MKNSFSTPARSLLRLVFLTFVISFFTAPAARAGLTLIAHYTFDNSGNLGQDSSGNGYDLNFNGADGVTFSGTAKAGPGAAYFDGFSYLSYTTTPTNILSTLAGDFSLSFWIQTTQNDGNEGGEAFDGAGIVAADVPGSHYDLVPAALDGGEIGFNTGPDEDTLNSTVDLNDGNYHHVVITRQQATGEKQIYVDGLLNNTDFATTSLLSDPHLVAVGCQIDASQSNPASASFSSLFKGFLDDIQIYSGVLSSNQVTQLYSNPGSTAVDFNAALNTLNLSWATSGDTSWFVETTNTDNGAPAAAQSGSVTNAQSSTLSVTVTGPAMLTFDWSCIANDPNFGFDYEFDIDGNYQDDISGDTEWYQDGSYVIGPGQHTLTWTAYAGGDTDPTEAAFLDQVSFVPATSLTVTASPLSGPEPLTVQFSSPGVDSASNTVTSWLWSFGDGGTSTAQNPVHTYHYSYYNPNTFSPNLVAQTAAGVFPVVIGPGAITVTLPSITATASPLSGAEPLTVQFSSPSMDNASNAVTSWNWDFGDGGTSTAQNPVHTYYFNNLGAYHPSLVVQSAGGIYPVVTGPDAITVTQPYITVTASPRSGTEPLTVQFSSPGVDTAGNTVTSWIWSFGDGTTNTAQNPVHTYGNLGSFTPNLVVQSAAGVFPVVIGPGAITASLSQSAFLTNLPGSPAAFTYQNFANAGSIHFNGSAATANTSDGAVLELTKSGSAQTGSAFSSNPLSFTHNVGFSTFFVFRLGNPGVGTPGDGITFTIQSDSPLALGNGGPGDSGIKNSLSVEFDAFTSGTQSTTSGGINTNQIAINTNGAASYLVSVPVTTNLNNGNLWYAWVDYEGVSQDLEVRLSQIPVRPSAPTLDTTVNLPGIFGITNTVTAGQSLTGNLLVNGGFENEPNWGGGLSEYYVPGSVTALVSNEVPGWTIEPNHALTIHMTGGIDPTITGEYSANPDGEGYDGNNANFYQDFANNANASYTLSFNWQSWGTSLATPTTSKQEVSVEDTVTGSVLFDGLYSYDGNGPHPVHAVTANFHGTGNPLRLRIQESPQSGYNDNTFMMDDFSVTGPPKYVNAYVGFTGAGENQQDILAWQFRPLPATRITGNFNATNLPSGLQINKGVVLVQHAYVVAGVIYTNYTYAPVTTVSNANAQIAFASGIAELNPASALPNPNAIGIALSNNAAALNSFDTFQYAMLAAYTNSGSGGQGAVINYDNPDYIQFAPYYANSGFPPFNMTEMTYDTLQNQVAANPPPGLFPPAELIGLQIGQVVGQSIPGPSAPQWISPGANGDIQGDSVAYSLGTFLGSMTASQQLVESPPVPLFISSPRGDGTNFVFDFSTVLNQSYTIWANPNLATTNWVSYTNLSGSGYFQEITIPLTNSPHSFYQLSSP